MLGILLIVSLFHVCIIFKIISYEIAWGGRLKNDAEMYVFESISIFINLFLLLVLLMKGNFIKYKFSSKFIKIILWIFLVLLIGNTIGNLFAKTNLEKFFALLTFISSILIGVIIKTKNVYLVGKDEFHP